MGNSVTSPSDKWAAIANAPMRAALENTRSNHGSKSIATTDNGFRHESGIEVDNRGVLWVDDLSHEAIDSFMLTLLAFFDKMQVWLGDTLVMFCEQFGSNAEELAEQYPISQRRIEEYIDVCSKVPRALRPDSTIISYSHLRLVAVDRYHDEHRRQYLLDAANQQMTVSEFKQYLQAKDGNKRISTRQWTRALVESKFEDFLNLLEKTIESDQLSRRDRLALADKLIQQANRLRNMDAKNAHAETRGKRTKTKARQS